MDFLLSLPFWLLLIALFPVAYLQNMAFTAVSRSRNAGNVAYHRRCAWLSNGIWFVTQFFFMGTVLPSLIRGEWWKVVLVFFVYVIATTEGSCAMMARLLKTETGDKRVGAR